MNKSKSFNFTPNAIQSLSFNEKQETYFDTSPRSLIPSCKLAIVVGSKTKTYYLVFRSNVNAKQVKKLVKLGQHPVMTVSLARDKFTDEAIKIIADQDKFLVEKKNIAITVNDLFESFWCVQ